ncbi:HNH endonuclease [Pseudorhodoferax sp. Leaf265]|uniref:HNH endonuclease n=1 Tax=Pseudorhodoferax sp. Leaf265 TaxID=1736315 RepID=UPI0012E8458A
MWRDAGTGTFLNPGVLMPTRIQSLRLQAFQRQCGLCFYCSAPMWLLCPSELPGCHPAQHAFKQLRCTAEHLLPQSEGGLDREDNIVAACARCNHTRHQRKRPPLPSAYREEVAKRMRRGCWHDSLVHRWLSLISQLAVAAAQPEVVRTR